jgi:hypothetical protein
VSTFWNTINRKEKNISILFYTGLLIFLFLLLNLVKYKCCLAIVSAANPWLLEYSGSTETADVKVIIWSDNQDSSNLFKEELPSDNWHWEKVFRSNVEGKKITGIVGRTKVGRTEELELKKWYYEFAARIKEAGGKVYLDERINDNIDIVDFLCKAGAEPQQWMLDNTTLSVAAWKSDLGNNIYAGKDKINMQLLTHVSSEYRQSVLALPVLIDEF